MTIAPGPNPELQQRQPRAALAPSPRSLGLLLAAMGCTPPAGSRPSSKPSADTVTDTDTDAGGEASSEDGPPPLSPGGTLLPPRAEDCVRIGDEDGDGLADCEDADCAAACVEDCADGRDNDADGLADCEDAECAAACAEDCADGRDNDADGLADCEDSDCREGCGEDCTDGLDNDADWQTDCLDVDCALSPFCRDSPLVTSIGGAQFTVRSGARTSWPTSRRQFQTVSALIDHLDIIPATGPLSDEGAPCGLHFEALGVYRRFSYSLRPHSSGGSWLDASAHAVTTEATGAGCPPPSGSATAAVPLDLLPTFRSRLVYFAVADLPSLRLSLYPLVLTPTGMRFEPLRSELTIFSDDDSVHVNRRATWSATASGFTVTPP